MKIKLFRTLFVLFFLIIGLKGTSQVVNSPYVPAGYKLVFDEEFDSAADKDNYWGKHGNRDWDQFVINGDGYCRLRNIGYIDSAGVKRFTVPSALTKQMFKYGYYECRYKYSKSDGINNSFWMIQNAAALDMQCLEIDINEGQLDEGGKRQHGSVQGSMIYDDAVRPLILEWSHNGNPSKAAYWYSSTLYGDSAVNLSERFITIGFEWTPKVMRVYCDSILMLEAENVVAKGPNAGDRWLNYPMPIYLSSYFTPSQNLADKAFDSEMVVDYVRVYQNDDSKGIGEAPTSGDNLLKNGGFGNMADNDYTPGHSTGSKQTMYSWAATDGSVKDGYYKVVSDTSRKSPYYIAQYIKPLPAGEYDLKFKAKMIGSQNARMTAKLSGNTDLSQSLFAKAASLNGSTTGDSRGTILLVKASQCQDWTEFHYLLTISNNPEDSEERFLFQISPTRDPVTYCLDDVVLTKVNTDPNEYISDNGFNFGLSGIWRASYGSYYSNGDVEMNRSIEQEGTNTFIRTTINKDHSPDAIYQTNINQMTVKSLENGQYKISLRARAASPETIGKHFVLQVDDGSGNTFYKSIASGDSEVTLSNPAKYLIFTLDSTEWKTYSATMNIANAALPRTARIYFRFPNAGTFDLDDVSMTKIESTGISEHRIGKSLDIEGHVVKCSDAGMEKMQIFGCDGRMISDSDAKDGCRTTVHAPGVYIVRLYKNGKADNYKIIIK